MNYDVIILAAGKGTRMKSDLPKVLMPFNGSTMIENLLSNLQTPTKPIAVVGYRQDLVRQALGERVRYAQQTELRGTGDAVAAALPLVHQNTQAIVVLYGDMPMADQKMVDKLLQVHSEKEATITMGVVSVPDFNSWREAFEKYGRVITKENGQVAKIVEFHDATADERKITNVNPAYFVFNRDWLDSHITEIKANNAQEEYYLTDLIAIAVNENRLIQSVAIDAQKGLGANTREQLEALEKITANLNSDQE